MTHDLKCWPESFAAIKRGDKTFEVRSSVDRDFKVGDVLLLRRWDPRTGNYVGDDCAWVSEKRSAETALRRRVTYVLHGGQFGLPPGICVMSIVEYEAT